MGSRGPVLLQDNILHETLAQFVHGQPVPRILHTKGYGAFGSFIPYQSMADCTALCFLQAANQPTPAAARFSLAISSRDTPDTIRNIRGFSVKFFSDGGVFDLLCNQLPVFLVRDALRFPEAVRALMPSPVNGLPDLDQFWAFVASAPESIHFITWLYSDQGTVKSFRHMRGYGVNTYVWVNREGRRRFVKYHWIPLAGQQNIGQAEAARLAGENPAVAGEDLYRSIAGGNPVEFELRVQMMEPSMAGSLSYDPLDCTKVWSEADFPLIPVGRLTLDRNPEEFRTQVENLAFSPANLLTGAELSDDRLLQGRANIYWNAQRLRLGPGFRGLSANRQQNWHPEDLVTSGCGTEVSGPLTRTATPLGDDFAQAGERFRGMEPEQQEHLISNLSAELKLVQEETRRTVLDYFNEADPELAQRLGAACR
ncbi:MAG: catalase [Oscillospiraceae bacterium]|nr:catalase [Oscillospiraceae bacterium]